MKKNSKKSRGWAIVSGTLLAGAYAGLYYVAKNKKEEAKKDADLSTDMYEDHGKAKIYHSSTLYESTIKTAGDKILSFFALVFLAPVFALVSLAIYIDDPGPVLFTQKRVGKNKTYFKIHKFRSMKVSTPKNMPTHMLSNPEQYITKVGKFIRKYSLDELPQIWDIFVGNMSVVGPRPALWNQEDLIAERDIYGANDVIPGLTGWAQINGRDELEIDTKAKRDGEYVAKLKKSSLSGFMMDVRCVFGTVMSVLKSDGVVEGGTGELNKAEVGRDYAAGVIDRELIGHIGFDEPVKPDFEAFKKVLITGAGSYIGESFATYANDKYAENFEITTLDMLDPSWREQDFSSYDIVYHVAGIAHADVGNVSDEVKEKYYAVNTDLALEVAEKAKEEGVKTFIFMSSMIVYGESAPYGKKRCVGFRTIPKPANFYGDSKLQADVAVRKLADRNFAVAVLRPPMIYGKGSKGNYPTLAKLAKLLPVFPDVANERSMLHIDNLCEFLCQLMLIDNNSYRRKARVFMPQNPEYTRTSVMVREIAKASGKKMMVTGLLNPAVKLAGKVPGKVSGLVNKAFGNMTYDMQLSEYDWLDYQRVDLVESIERTEKKTFDSKQNIVYESLSIKDTKSYSVLMSVYKNDTPEYLQQAVESMLKQTVEPEQFVIVKDGPIDTTLELLIDSYVNSNPELFTIVSLEKNGGLGNALNHGLDVCRNELVARMDADDISFAERCEKQLEFFRANPDVVILGAQINEFIGSCDNIVSSRIVPCSMAEIRGFAKRRSPFNHPTVMFRKSIVQKMGGYAAYGRKEDLDLFIRAVNEGLELANLDEVLLYYRTSEENFQRRKTWTNCKEYIEIMYGFYKDHYIGSVDMAYVLFGQLILYVMPSEIVKNISNALLRKKVR